MTKLYAKYELENAEDIFSLLPDGEYELVIESAEEKETKSGGKMISMRLVVPSDADKYAGAGFYVNYNVVNSNPVAERIGRAELRKLFESTKSEDVDELGELVGKSFSAIVGTQAGKNGYSDSNKIKKYV